MTEDEWRALGIQQSQGWIHYMFHKPGINILSKAGVIFTTPMAVQVCD